MAQKQYANKRDFNEPEIIKALEEFGASVIVLNKFDLIAGYQGLTHLMEVKNPDTDWSLTSAQKKIINTWQGSPLNIVTTPEIAVNIVRRHAIEDKGNE